MQPTTSTLFLPTWFGFGEASSHGGPRIEGHQRESGREEGGEGGEAQSDPWTGLLGLEETIMQNWRYENLQVQTGHRTRQLLHIICCGHREQRRLISITHVKMMLHTGV